MATNDIRGIPKIPKHEILIYVSRNGSRVDRIPIYNYICHQCHSPRKCQWLVVGWWFSHVSSTNKTCQYYNN